jgi:hypothetical protein
MLGRGGGGGQVNPPPPRCPVYTPQSVGLRFPPTHPRIRAAGGRQRTGGVDTIYSSFAAAPTFTSLSPFPATLYLASTLIAY